MRSIGISSLADLPDGSIAFLGTEYGGYAVPTEIIRGSVGLSFGAGEDISFEVVVAGELAATVHIYDPTPRSIEYCQNVIEDFNGQDRLGEVFLYPFGVWSEHKIERFYSPSDPAHVSYSILNMQNTDEYFEAECLTPTDILKQLELGSVDFVKLNIEGAEYEVINAMFDSRIIPSVICITFDELHSPIDRGASDRMRNLVGRFAEQSYLPVHIRDCKVTFVQSEQVAYLNPHQLS